MDSPREWPSLSSLIQGMGVSILCPQAPAALSLTASPQLPRAGGESPQGPGTSASLWNRFNISHSHGETFWFSHGG